ncbi:MAG: hypothetical protein ABFR31_02390 [Thermodesulfobacteriota bacterium]
MQDTTISKMVEPLKSGELFVKEGLIRFGDIDMALSIQEAKKKSLNLNKPKLIGIILCSLNLITPKDNYYVLHKYNKLMSIQTVLIENNMLSKYVVSEIYQESRQQNMPFISSLLNKGVISTTKLQQLLFDLFHIPFRPISDFVFNQKDRNQLVEILDRQNSKKNSVVPLVLKDNTILFGITEPENILFIGELNDYFPQYRFKTIFIPFSNYLDIYKTVYDSHVDLTVDSTVESAPLPEEEPIDLSLLLNFKTSIGNPEIENRSIETLYQRYELLRQLSGNSKRKNYLHEFNDFIIQCHKTITEEYKNRSIEFSLKKEGNRVKIVAFPQ